MKADLRTSAMLKRLLSVLAVLLSIVFAVRTAQGSTLSYKQNLVNSTGRGNGNAKFFLSSDGTLGLHAFFYQQQNGPCAPTPTDIGFAFYLGGQLSNYFYAQQCDGPWSGDGQFHWTMYDFVGNSPCGGFRGPCSTLNLGDWAANNFFILGGGLGGGAYTDPQGNVTPALVLQDDTALPPDPLGLPITVSHADSLILEDSSTVWSGGNPFVAGTLTPVPLSPPLSLYTAPQDFTLSRIHVGANNDFSTNNHDLLGNVAAFISAPNGTQIAESVSTCYVEGGCSGADLTFPPDTTVPANFSLGLVLVDGIQGRSAFNVSDLSFFAEKPHPSIATLNQLEPDGVTAIPEGATIGGGSVVFNCTLQSNSTDPLVLQVEFQPFTTPFLNIVSATSAVVTAGQTASLTLNGLPSAQYHWQARAVDLDNFIASSWQEFGSSGNVDFTLSAQLAPPTGKIAVSTNNQQATFTVTDGASQTFSGTGTAFSQTEPVGTYTITFGDVPGFATPDPQTEILVGGGSITFNGIYKPLPPENLHATIGNATVYLDWSSSPVPNPDGYNIYLEQFTGDHFVALGTVNAVNLPFSGTNIAITGQFGEGTITNGTVYRFHVTAVKNAAESAPSNFILARPGQLAIGQPSSPPTNPILFLHGIASSASTWNSTKSYLTGTLGWKFGGILSYGSNEDPTNAQQSTALLTVNDPENIIAPPGRANFFTANFGSPTADYTAGRPGIRHQADEIAGFLRTLKLFGTAKVNLVAHSMGGLAARTYIAENASSATTVRELVTYGTPHWGVPRFDETVTSPILLYKGLLPTEGLKEMTIDCSLLGELDYSNNDFFDWLRTQPLNSNIAYFTIRGDQLVFPGFCLSTHNDGAVRLESATLATPAGAPAGQPLIISNQTKLLTTDKSHTDETSDFSSILCALDSNCSIYQAHSPVSLEITAPDGRVITNDLTEIPGASYMEVPEDGGGTSATVILPFPENGTYSVKVVPKPDAAPTDTYSLDVTRAGVKSVLAQNQSIQSIPAQPYIVPVLAPLGIDIKPGSNPNSIKLGSGGKIPVAILSTADFDAPSRIDASTLTFGHFGDEASLAFCNTSGEDVNGDALPDLVCHFFTQETGFIENDAVGALKGKTKDGVPFVGTDSVRIIP